jgi:IclR family pca regulon transcriptional regulator
MKTTTPPRACPPRLHPEAGRQLRAVVRARAGSDPLVQRQRTAADAERGGARTGLTRAGARRILLTLQTLGYVESDGKLFRLTPRILDLGFAYLSSMPIWNLAEPVMEELVEQVRESCSAAVLDGLDIVYVLRVPTHKIMRTTWAWARACPRRGHPWAGCCWPACPTTSCMARLTASEPAAHTAPHRNGHAHAAGTHTPGAHARAGAS